MHLLSTKRRTVRRPKCFQALKPTKRVLAASLRRFTPTLRAKIAAKRGLCFSKSGSFRPSRISMQSMILEQTLSQIFILPSSSFVCTSLMRSLKVILLSLISVRSRVRKWEIQTVLSSVLIFSASASAASSSFGRSGFIVFATCNILLSILSMCSCCFVSIAERTRCTCSRALAASSVRLTFGVLRSSAATEQLKLMTGLSTAGSFS
mmetsp:Transcript_10494/g.19092  ORF Transcript_10494/g.19092 Transcript_10494/m.19092 type:complete len:207 (-) Transcript_10494:382-1002(-)